MKLNLVNECENKTIMFLVVHNRCSDYEELSIAEVYISSYIHDLRTNKYKLEVTYNDNIDETIEYTLDSFNELPAEIFLEDPFSFNCFTKVKMNLKSLEMKHIRYLYKI